MNIFYHVIIMFLQIIFMGRNAKRRKQIKDKKKNSLVAQHLTAIQTS